MSTIVCQNLVSCFESQLTETTTTLKLKVAAAAPPPAALDFCKKLATDDNNNHPQSEAKTNHEFGNWGFLQTIPNKESSPGDNKSSCYTYTHPLSRKSSFSRLSAKSLELCTENLGSETGTDIITDSSSISVFSSSANSIEIPNPVSDERLIESDDGWKQKTKSPKNTHHKEANSCRNFPPPLTSMSGSSSLQVLRHREGGRLIIEAVEAPFRNSYLQAERSDGRLRLCFLRNSDAAETATSGDGDKEEEAEEDEIRDECREEMAAEEEIEDNISEFESENEEFDGEVNSMEMEMEMEKFQWLSRCKEGGHGNWKPALWVATS